MALGEEEVELILVARHDPELRRLVRFLEAKAKAADKKAGKADTGEGKADTGKKSTFPSKAESLKDIDDISKK